MMLRPQHSFGSQKLLLLFFVLASSFVFFHNNNLVVTVDAQEDEDTVTTLQPQEFYEMATSNAFAAIIDVRRSEEWEEGHIPNATLMQNLQMDVGQADFVATIDDIIGCKSCPMVVYCRTGARASAALKKLVAAGFEGPLYNGLGVNDWTDADYALVQTESVAPQCTRTPGNCKAEEVGEEETLGIADDAKNNSSNNATMNKESSSSNGISVTGLYLLIGVLSFFLVHF